MPTAPDPHRPLTPDEVDGIYDRATRDFIRRSRAWERWVAAGRPADGAAPPPPDPSAWPDGFHPDVRPRLRAFLAARASGRAAEAAPPPPSWHGQARLGEFAIDRRADGTEVELGRGGMGVVVAARESALDRPVAIKFMLPSLRGDPALVQQFRVEGLLQSRLQHAGVAPVYRVGQDDGRGPFIVMKPIRGVTFGQLLGRTDGPVDPLDVLLAVARTVGYAHGQGKCHLDLKPGNVLVGPDGEAWVMDWGLAQESGGAGPVAAGQPGSGRRSARGTPGYMSPEQARPDAARVGPRADVFALGAMLCEVLTGTPAFTGPNGQVLERARAGDLRDAFARLEQSGADGELVDLCMRCLAAEPEQRPADGAAVADALARARAAVADKLRASEQAAAAAEARSAADRKNRRLRLALGATAVALAFGLGGFAWWADRRRAAEELRLARLGFDLDGLAGRGEGELRADRPDAAEATLDEIGRRIPDAGAEAIRSRLDRLRADLLFLRELDRIDEFRWLPADGGVPDGRRVASRWAAAFRDFGIAPGVTAPEEAARRVTGSPIRERLLGALDLWLVAAPSPAVRAILTAADPDGYREGVRDAVLEADGAALARRAGPNTAFVQPPRFAAALAEVRAIPAARRREILAAAHASAAKNLAVLMALAGSHPAGSRPDAANRVHWLSQAATGHPTCFAAHHNLGLALRDAGRPDEALQKFQAALDLRPDSPLPHDGRGRVLADRKQFDDAVRAFRRATALDPAFAAPRHGLGDALLRKGLPDEAIPEFLAAFARDRTSAAPLDGLVSAYRRKGDAGGAVRELRGLLDRDPASALLRTGLGNALAAAGDLPGAVREFRAALVQEPLAAAHEGLGCVYLRQNNVFGAIDCFQAAIDRDPTFARARLGMGTAQWARNDRDRAMREFRTALDLDPSLAAAHHGLGLALAHRGDYLGAIAAFEAAVDRDPTAAAPYRDLGQVLGVAGRWAEAKKAYRGAVAADATDARPHFGLGTALCRTGDLDGGIEAFRAALRLDPAFTAAHVDLGHALAERDDLDGAVAAYEDARRARPKGEPRLPVQANELLARGDTDGAAEAYRKAVRDKSPWSHPYRHLARLLGQRGEWFAALRVLEDEVRATPAALDRFRFDLARCACGAAGGRAKDGPAKVDGGRLYRSALAWLDGELAARRGRAADARSAADVHRAMLAWLADADLAATRDAERLPADLREGWARFWTGVRKLRDDTAPAK